MEENSPKIVIEFVSPGSALFEVKMEGAIFPQQLHAVAQWLNVTANHQIVRAMEMREVQVAQPAPRIEVGHK